MENKEYWETSPINQLVNENMEKYLAYKEDNESVIAEDVHLIELLDKLGFDTNKPGTYLFKELVSEIYDDVIASKDKTSEYKNILVFKDLNKDRPFLYRVISDRLGIKEEAFAEYIYDAVSTIDKADPYLCDSKKQSAGIMAYNIAMHYEQLKKIELNPVKKNIKLVKKIKKK